MNLLSRIGLDGFNLWMGVEWSGDGPYPVMILKKQKDEIKTIEKQVLTHKKELFQFLKKHPGLPILIHLSEVLGAEKCLPIQTGNVISQTLGVQVDKQSDYLWQAIPTSDGQQWVKVIRREEVDSIFEELKEIKKRAIGLAFSPVTSSFLIPGMAHYDPTKRYLFDEQFPWKDGLLSNNDSGGNLLRREDLAYQLNMTEAYLPLYGATVHNFLADGKDIFQFEELAHRRQAFKNQLTWLKSLVLGFAFLMLVSLGALLTREVFEIRKKSGQQVLSASSSLITQMDDNQRQIAQKSAFFQQKSLQISKASLFLDRIGNIKPDGLQLSDLIFHGEEERIKKISPDLLTQDIDIILLGSARTVELIRSISSELEAQEWTTKVSLWKSTYDFREQRHFFTISIKRNE